MGRRGDDLLTANEDMDKLRSLFYIGFCYPAQGFFAGLFILCPGIITNYNIFNDFPAFIQQDHFSGSKT